jgi:hypothetical protein
LRSCHNDVVRHLGVTATCRKLQEAGHSWNGMRVDVVNFVHSSPFCQKPRVTVKDTPAPEAWMRLGM